MADAGLQLSFQLFEDRLELLEVFADGAIGDFLSGAFVSALADVFQLGDAARRALQFGQ
jgi:hypothetical protein